jgi:hypothetical protein
MAQIYPAGSVHHLERGKVKQYSFAGECWALEYAVGESPESILLSRSLAEVYARRMDPTDASIRIR